MFWKKDNLLLKETTVLGLNEDVRLRREESAVIIYWAAPVIKIDYKITDTSLRYLSPSIAMVLALFDGKRMLGEVFKAVKYIWAKPSLTFASFCKKLEKFITNIPPFNFEVPVLIKVSKKKRQKFIKYNPESFIIKDNKFSLSYASPLKFPIRLDLMPSMECFTDCIYCYMGHHIAPKYSPLPFSRWRELLKETEKYQLSDISFAGGDPMHYEHIIDMLEIVSSLKPHPSPLVSTKSYISRRIASQLVNIKGLHFQISLDSTNHDIADAMVQRKGYGKRAIESIKNLMSAGLTPAVKAVVTPLNIKFIPQTILDLKNLGVYLIRVTIYMRSSWSHKDEFFNKKSDWEELKKRVAELKAKYDISIILQGEDPEEDKYFPKIEKNWKERNLCTAGKWQLTILPDGHLLGCEQIPQIPEYFLGSVAKDSIYNVWHSKSFKEKAYDIPREKYKGTACYSCEKFADCHSALGKGYCMREAHRSFGTIYAPDPACPYSDKEILRMQ